MPNFSVGYVMGIHRRNNKNLCVITTKPKQRNHKGFTMGNFYSSGLIRRSILCTTAVTFLSGSVCTPLLASYEYAAQAKGININLNDAAFIYRLEKLYEKAKRYVDKLESGKLIEVMYDIKLEIEAYTGKKVDIDGHIDQIERDAKKQGAQFKKGEIKQYKKDIKKTGKKHGHKAVFLYECNMYGIDFSQEACDLDFNYMLSKSAKHHGKDDEKEVKVPIRVSIGITASLCGYFLSFIPHPYAQAASKFLIATGVGLCVDGTITRMEEDEKEQQQNQGKQ